VQQKLKVGCDPELFLVDARDGSFVSGHGVLPGTKTAPHKVNRGAVQIDGTALEFNTDPAESCDEFLGNIEAVMAQMQELAGGDRLIRAVPVAEYTDEYFRTIPPEALELGCNPDYNAWTFHQNDPPNAFVTFRTGSGHIHLGWGEDFDYNSFEHFELCARVARQMDYYVGIASLLWDGDNRRRELYGKAGAMRPKPYGMEYRVPSNAWLNTEATRRFVYEATVKAFEDLMRGDDKSEQFGDLARQIIDTNNASWRDQHDFNTGLDYEVIANVR
jgi:hypothetical protein